MQPQSEGLSPAERVQSLVALVGFMGTDMGTYRDADRDPDTDATIVSISFLIVKSKLVAGFLVP